MSSQVLRFPQIAVVAIVTFITALMIALPVAIVLNDQAALVAKRNSIALCQISAQARPPANARTFIEREILGAAMLYVETLPRTSRILFDNQVNRALHVEREAEIMNARRLGIGPIDLALPANAPNGFADLQRALRDLPLIDCSRSLQ